MTSAPFALPPRTRLGRDIPNPVRLLLSARPWKATAFLVVSFGLGISWFCALTTLLAVGLGSVIMIFGLPMLVGTMVLWTWGARAERWRIAAMWGARIRPSYRPLPPVREGKLLESWAARFRTFATDPAVWLDLCYLLLLFPIGIIEFVIAAFVIVLPLHMVMLPIVVWASGPHEMGPGIVINTAPEATIVALAGIPLLLLVPYILVGMTNAHVVLARAMLGLNRQEELEARVGELTESRSRAVDAALAERRRIERDLHDGAQQRLVALAMNLGMAKHKLDSDPDAARRLMDDAHEEARHAMVELRNLVRGVHPAVLSDRGLDAAISALAGQCSVPVAVDVELDERLPDVVESAAYFVVAEALTNVAKHSVATEAYVGVHREGRMLVVEVTDNGIGGADAGAGTGLAGLAGRVAALDGRLTVESPRGGGTRLRAELPCAL